MTIDLMKRSLLAVGVLIFTLLGSQALAFDNATKDKIISLTLQNFWGKAKLSDGSYVQPERELDRQTLPIQKDVAYQVIEVGMISGLARWCSLDWEKNYRALTGAARREGFSEKQVAFIGLLHGVTQGMTESAVKDRKCSTTDRETTRKKVEKSPNASLKSPRF
jgi:hypothetical protein